MGAVAPIERNSFFWILVEGFFPSSFSSSGITDLGEP
jgi:hypothetical protein